MHPEIARLRALGVARTLDVYNSLTPPPYYVAGVGRGARGFTLEQGVHRDAPRAGRCLSAPRGRLASEKEAPRRHWKVGMS